MTRYGFGFFNRQAIVLGCFALVIGSLLWAINALTIPQIEKNQHALLVDSLNQILPDSRYDNDLTKSAVTVFDTAGKQNKTIYAAYYNKKPAAAIIKTSTPDGYAGEITLLVGIDIGGVITGVRVLQHQETPGLGDDIELRKSRWVLDFNGKSVATPLHWAVTQDGGTFDQFTGATITPRAVVGAVRQTLAFFRNHQSAIFSARHD